MTRKKNPEKYHVMVAEAVVNNSGLTIIIRDRDYF